LGEWGLNFVISGKPEKKLIADRLINFFVAACDPHAMPWKTKVEPGEFGKQKCRKKLLLEDRAGRPINLFLDFQK